jgi:hypothetical protein
MFNQYFPFGRNQITETQKDKIPLERKKQINNDRNQVFTIGDIREGSITNPRPTQMACLIYNRHTICPNRIDHKEPHPLM